VITRRGALALDGRALLVLAGGFREPGHPVAHPGELQDGELHLNRARARLALGVLEGAAADLAAAASDNAVRSTRSRSCSFTEARGPW
jgi:hypothetical protein